MQNKKSTSFLALAVAIGLAAFGVSSYGYADDSDHGPWGIGLRGGAALLSQDVNSNAFSNNTGNVGPVVELEGQYDFTKHFSVGVGAEWQYNSLTTAGTDAGSVTTISILPFVRYQLLLGAFHPYASVAAGYNINKFDPPSPLSASSFSLHNSFAVKPGAGLDWFVAKHLAVNAEIDWKWNKATLYTNPATTTTNLNMSSIQFLAGAKYFF